MNGLRSLELARILSSKDTIPFVFDSNYDNKDPKALVVRVPGNVSDRDALMQILARELQFPAYFGHNWDALTDCLRDFSWLEAHQIVLVHEGLPLYFPADDLTTYLEILMRSVREWELREEPEHELVVVFSTEAREPIERLLRD